MLKNNFIVVTIMAPKYRKLSIVMAKVMCRENASVFHNLTISLNQETCRDKFSWVYGSSALSVYYVRDREQLASRLYQ